MTHKRLNDNKEYSDLFYTDRYFSENDKWYYYARGMIKDNPFVIGPFLSKNIAVNDCNKRFIKNV